jgi:hypothetical protein
MKRYYILEDEAYTIKKLIKKFGCFPDGCDQVFELKKGENAVLMKLFNDWVIVTPDEHLESVRTSNFCHQAKGKKFIYLNC